MERPHWPGLDLLRAIAILSVAFYHYRALPYGYLGVDLFFVLSGYLVGGRLLESLFENRPLPLKNYLASRAKRIFPAYFGFLIFSVSVMRALYGAVEAPHGREWIKYYLFVVNYAPQGTSWLAHLWSLSVEIHYYLLLPLGILLLRRIGISSRREVSLALVVGIVLVNKIRWALAVHDHEVVVTSHARIDSFLWGMLVYAMPVNSGFGARQRFGFIFGGVAFLVIAIVLEKQFHTLFYTEAVFHGLTPLSFFLFVLAFARWDVPSYGPVTFLAKHAYQYYLWHLLPMQVFLNVFGETVLGLVGYAASGLLMAVVARSLFESSWPLVAWRAYAQKRCPSTSQLKR